MKDYYVILTGSKNNAGDFLIKYRAKKLFELLRPYRDIIDYEAWIPFDDERLSVVNNSKALILLGGPSLQINMRPNIYPMVDNLDDIKVPILSMGIGWKSLSGNWSDTYNYNLNKETLCLLDRINNSGFFSSVRDYHTLNTLYFKGFNNFIMTGCPAYYDLEHINKDIHINKKVNKVAFSLGVSFLRSRSMEELMKEQILYFSNYFSDQILEVTFHHSLNENIYNKTHGSKNMHIEKHKEFANWLKSNNIRYTDISGSAEKLINYYKNVDLHIGYRVHAHIFMNSISKRSVLIAEDGRGKATKDVIGGIVIEGVTHNLRKNKIRVIKKFTKNIDNAVSNKKSIVEITNAIEYEMLTNFHRTNISRKNIDENYLLMKKYIETLP